MPIIYTSTNRTVKRFYEIYHHGLAINCQDFGSGSPCPGFESGPKALRQTSSDSSARIYSAMWNHAVIVQSASAARIYYPGFRVSGWTTETPGNPSVPVFDWAGIGCWDILLNQSCQFIAITNDLRHQMTMGRSLGGIGKVGNRLFLSLWGKLHCWDLVGGANKTGAKCGAGTNTDKPFVFAAETYQDSEGDTQNRFHSGVGTVGSGATDMMVTGNRIYAVINGWMSCVEAGTWPLRLCSRKSGTPTWPVQSTWHQLNGDAYHVVLSPYLDAAGSVIGACMSVGAGWSHQYGNAASYLDCYKNDATKLTNPAILESAKANYWLAQTSTPLGTKVYYALSAAIRSELTSPPNGSAGMTACSDFKTNAVCPAFTDGGTGAVVGLRRWNQPNKNQPGRGNIGITEDYGYTHDVATGCLFGLGNAGTLWSFDPSTGNSPCSQSRSDFVVPDLKPFCDDLSRTVGWQKVILRRTPSQVRSIAINVYDASTCTAQDAANCPANSRVGSGALTLTGAPTTNQEVTLTPTITDALSLSKVPSIRVTIAYTYLNGIVPPASAWDNFSASVYYNPDPNNQAIVQNCPAPHIDNLVTVKEQATGKLLSRALRTITTDVPLIDESDVPVVYNSESNQILRASYRRADWSGDLVAYNLDAQGNATGMAWTRPVNGTTVGTGASMLQPTSGRYVLTWGAENSYGTRFAYAAWAMNSTSPVRLSEEQQEALGSSVTERTDLVNYIRGSRVNEVGQTDAAGSPTGKQIFRRRAAGPVQNSDPPMPAMGPILSSRPVYDSGMVYVQTNDGMVRAINASTGAEVFTYVPGTVYSELTDLARIGYMPRPVTNGQLAVLNAPHANNPNRRMLIGSTGVDSSTIFGIDVSGLPGAQVISDRPRFEKTHDALGRADGAIQSITLGSTTYALLGNGVGSESGVAQLILVNPGNAAITAISTGQGGTATVSNGLSSPTVLSENGSPVAIYAGDAMGNLWRFAVKNNAIESPVKLFAPQKVGARPITAAPVIQTGGVSSDGRFIFFATGAPIDRTDSVYDMTPAAETTSQRIYGVFDNLVVKNVRDADLVQQTFVNDVLTSNSVDLSTKKGWYVELGASDKASGLGAERVVGSLRFDSLTQSLTVVTSQPKADFCGPKAFTSNAIVLNALTGGASSLMYFIDANVGKSRISILPTLTGPTQVYSGRKIFNLTSNAAGSKTPSKNGATWVNPGISTFTTERLSISLKRTSWIQMY